MIGLHFHMMGIMFEAVPVQLGGQDIGFVFGEAFHRFLHGVSPLHFLQIVIQFHKGSRFVGEDCFIFFPTQPGHQIQKITKRKVMMKGKSNPSRLPKKVLK